MAKVNDIEVPDFRLRGAGLKWRKCATSKILGSPGASLQMRKNEDILPRLRISPICGDILHVDTHLGFFLTGLEISPQGRGFPQRAEDFPET